MGNNLVSVVDSLPIVRNITDIIIDKNREDAKTERLEIEADVYKCRIVEESKRFLAELEKRDRENERNYNLKIAELNLKLAEDIREFNLKMKTLELDYNVEYKKKEMRDKAIEQNNKTLSVLSELLKLDPLNKEILETIKFLSRDNFEILNLK